MGQLTGVGVIVRLALRRDRLLLPVWVALFAGMAGVSAAATVGLYPDVAARVRAAESINASPALVALYGRISEVTSLGAVAMIKLTGFGAALLAALAVVLVVRHTRGEEESGRAELVASGVVGRYAILSAALLVAGGTMAAIGALTASALVLAGLPASGSVAFGLAWAGTGMAFAALAGVAAQLTVSARAASGLAGGVLGLAYLLRAIGDSAAPGGPRWLSWLSPVGWGQQVRAFAGNRWLALAPLAGLAVAAIAGAYALLEHRDLGGGVLPDRPGPASAAPALRSPLALSWRLSRTTLAAWAGALAVLGYVVGSVAGNLGGLVDSPQARELILRLGGARGLTDAFLAFEMTVLGLLTAGYAVQTAMRLHVEEAALRTEAVLATAVSRQRWAGSIMLVAFAGSVLLLLAAGLGAAGATAVHGTGVPASRVVAGALVQVPAVLVLAGIVVAAYGLAPRFVGAGWAALVAFLVLDELGSALRLPQWVRDLSPFAHVPRLPGAALAVAPMLWLSLLAAALTAAGLAAFRRRDVG